LAELRKSRLALVGPAAQELGVDLAAAGFELADGGGAIVDLAAAAERVPEIRQRYAPVVGLIAQDANPPPGADWEAVDALIRLPHAASDLPPLLRTLIRAAEDRGELQRQARSRQLEAELRKTKEFLERLIDATADGIVAADPSGNILLFNKGAERMTGFSAAELVGKANVAELYPAGLAASITGRLRAAHAAGEELGHLRCELVAKNGEVIPVDLSAAIVAEQGRDTATVSVLRDLREELRRDAELTQTQKRLEAAEKAAVISELAGAAAHELNQPLTSVLGFSELLFRRTQENEKGREELAAILREAERMATIVRKIGRITRYETTAYVGKTRIVDLERASNPPPVILRDKG
jgi:PAS domain S-box-containing protein